jgi:hypothetical protein
MQNLTFHIIFGMAGTGKTFRLAQLIKSIPQRNFIVIAPTHSALNTLRKFLPTMPPTKFRTLCSYFRIDYARDKIAGPTAHFDTIFVDEFSLINKRLFGRCLQYIRKPTHLVLCGDVMQLTAIHLPTEHITFQELRSWHSITKQELIYPEVLEHLHLSIFSIPSIRGGQLEQLTETHRFNEQVLKIIQQIYFSDEFSAESINFLAFTDVLDYMTNKNYTMIAARYDILQKFYDQTAPKNAIEIKNKKQASNNFSRLYLTEGCSLIVSETILDLVYNGEELTFKSVENEHLLCTRNDGSLVIIDRLETGPDQGCYPVMPSNFLTVHKSQGRSIPNVIACIDDLFGISMFYTQITRAMNNLYFYTAQDDKIKALQKVARVKEFQQLKRCVDDLV